MQRKFHILRGFCLGPELGDALPGEERDDIPAPLVSRLEHQGKIRAIPEPIDDSAVKAKALAEAHAELLEQIGAASTIEDLDKLLSEDPEIVAAYEKRLTELEEESGKAEAARIMEGLTSATSEAEAVALISGAKTDTALNILKSAISEQENGLHAAIAKRLAELDEPHH